MDGRETPVKRKRRYDSTGRQAAARRTRERIVAAAERRFLRDGYAPTTVEAIAGDVGVAVDTIYKTFGGKPGLVRGIYERALAGEGPVHAEVRSDALHTQGLDGHDIIRAWGAFVTEVAPRVVPLMLLLRDGATHDAELRALLEEFDAARHRRMRQNARRLRDGGHLREEITIKVAADVLWTYSSQELYELLVLRRGWTSRRYGQFVADAMISALL